MQPVNIQAAFVIPNIIHREIRALIYNIENTNNHQN